MTVWLNAESHGRAAPGKAIFGYPGRAKTELGQGRHEPPSIGLGWPNQDIQVQGQARVAVEGDGMSTTDEKLDVVLLHQADELAHAFRHQAVLMRHPTDLPFGG
jgi:hypothetical protein